jgi:hypothetical protein
MAMWLCQAEYLDDWIDQVMAVWEDLCNAFASVSFGKLYPCAMYLRPIGVFKYRIDLETVLASQGVIKAAPILVTTLPLN